MSKRGHISMTEKAAALAAVVLGIPYEHRVLMSAEQVLSLLNFDHDPVPYAHGGSDEHFNLTPLSIMGHREKTAKHDVPMIAKTKRIRDNTAHHAARMAVKSGDPDKIAEALAALGDRRRAWPKRKMQSRPFDKGKHKLRGRR